MNCSAFRDQMMRGAETAETARHRSECEACAEFGTRVERVQAGLRAHHVDLQPDSGFVTRVRRRLDGTPAVALGWAAVRVLPMTAAAILLLIWLTLRLQPVEPSRIAAPTDDLLTWFYEQGSGEEGGQ